MSTPSNKIPWPDIDFDTIILKGGMDQVTPTLSLDNGVCRESLNFEEGVETGRTRIAGYERCDGRTSPSDSTTARAYVSVAVMTHEPTVGETVTGDDSGETGVVAIVDGLDIGLCKVSGDFQEEQIKVGATVIGTIDNLVSGPTTPKKEAQFENAIADIYRADIAAPVGSGALLGITVLNDVKYTFRDNAAGTFTDIWKTTAAGHVQVPLLLTVSFTLGGAGVPVDGNVLTQGGVTATIKRIALTSGEWADSDAAGQFIITTLAGGNFAAGAATAGAVGCTLSAIQTAITIPANGRYEIIEENFSATGSKRAYGVNGVGTAFEFDGTVFVPIYTGAATDTPKHIFKHRDLLVLSIGPAYRLSVATEPYNFTGTEGAIVVGTGDTITGFMGMPGDVSNSALLVFNRSRYNVLYGKTSTDFNFVQYSREVGVVDYTVQTMGDAIAFDDRGVYNVKPGQDYGNFVSTTLTRMIQPYIAGALNTAVATTVNRTKSQYRLFFSDGAGLYITIVNGKMRGAMPILFPDVPYCTWEGKLSTGEDVSFFGGTDGMLYQLDKGSSFDGDAIQYQFALNYSPARSPRIRKTFNKAAFELNAESNNAYVELTIGYKLGYDSARYSQPANMSYTAYLAATRWDDFAFDDFFWDAKSLESLNVRMGGSAENYAFFIFGSSDYVQPFTINSMITHYIKRRVMR